VRLYVQTQWKKAAAPACMHISAAAAAAAVHNIIQQSQPTHTQQLVWLFKTGSAAST
jgi:hypothetical protein